MSLLSLLCGQSSPLLARLLRDSGFNILKEAAIVVTGLKAGRLVLSRRVEEPIFLDETMRREKFEHRSMNGVWADGFGRMKQDEGVRVGYVH